MRVSHNIDIMTFIINSVNIPLAVTPFVAEKKKNKKHELNSFSAYLFLKTVNHPATFGGLQYCS